MSGALSWLAPLASAGASIYGAYQANRSGQQQQQAATQAGQLSANATNAQTNLLAQMYNQTRADQAPYRAAGQQGLEAYTQNLSQPFQQTPGYQFMQNEGQRAVMANAAQRGLVNSGGTLRALQDRGMGIADQTYGQYMNRLAALSGIGQTAAGQGAQAAGQYGQAASNVMGQGAQTQGQYLTAGAGAAAGGQNAASNALMGGANNLLSWYMGK